MKNIIFFSVVCIALIAMPAFADVNTYLNDEQDTALRIQVVTPPEVLKQQQTFWGKLRSLLGARNVFRIQPPPGTKFTVQSSAYAPSPYQTDATPCITAAGTRVRPGVVATNFLPMGTILDINGQRFIVEDRMNGRYQGYYMDLWFPSTSQALEFGRKNLEITIIEYGSPGQDIRPSIAAKEEIQEEAVEDESVWVKIREVVTSATSLLSANTRNADQYDVDCFKDEN